MPNSKRYLLYFSIIISLIIFADSLQKKWEINLLKYELVDLIMHNYINQSLMKFPCPQKLDLDPLSQNNLQIIKSQLNLSHFNNNVNSFHIGVISCLLNDPKEALNYFLLGSELGDHWQALTSYLIFVKLGDYNSAKKLLYDTKIGVIDLYNFHLALIHEKNMEIDFLELAKYAIYIDYENELSWEIWLSGCRVLHKSYDYDLYLQALDCYDSALEAKEYLPNNELSYIFISRGDIKKGLFPYFTTNDILFEYNKAIQYDPNNTLSYLRIAKFFLKNNKNLEEALKYINNALLVDPSSSEAYIILGDIYKAQGDKNNAMNAYKNALDLIPNWLIALERIRLLEFNDN